MHAPEVASRLASCCRWAIAAIVLMKKSWAADDANVGNVSVSHRLIPSVFVYCCTEHGGYYHRIAPSQWRASPQVQKHHLTIADILPVPCSTIICWLYVCSRGRVITKLGPCDYKIGAPELLRFLLCGAA